MELIHKKTSYIGNNDVSTEIQQKQKQEYKMIGKYWVNKSLKLFQYNPSNCEVSFVERISESNGKGNIYIVAVDGKLEAKDLDYEKAVVDSRMIFFEAMSLKTANIRVQKWKDGKIKELCNLREWSKFSGFF